MSDTFGCLESLTPGYCQKMKPVRKPVKSAKKHSKVDLTSLDASFSELQRTNMTKTAAEARKTAKLIPVRAKLSVPNRETVSKTSEELEKLLKDF